MPSAGLDLRRLFQLAEQIRDANVRELESRRDQIVAFCDQVTGLRDPLEGQLWRRFPIDLVRTGLWHELPMCAKKAYWALLFLVERRTLSTRRGLAGIAEAARISEKRASAGLTALKEHGVISRYRISYGPWRPYLTKILSPRRWVWSDGTPVLGQGLQERP
jgi:hypothetical protein